MPPTRRSISASVTSPLFACHQRLTNSGVVHARYTKCFGASHSRVIRICVSVGRVTVAVPLLVTAISFLLLFEFLEHDIELVEPLRPQALVALHPVVDRLERRPVQPVEPLPAVLTNLHGSDFAKYSEVLGHLWLGEPELPHEVVHRPFPAREDVENQPPPGLGHGVESVCGRRCSCHGPRSYTDIGICQATRTSPRP